MTRDEVQVWLDAYIAAWRSYDAAAIGALFADDARYAYHPYDEPLEGREAIVASWLGERDGAVFSNLFELEFRAGRCVRFIEWYVQHPARRS